MTARVMKQDFRTWVESSYGPGVAASRLANCKRVERHYGDLDRLYGNHRMTSLLSCLSYSTDDERHGRVNPSRIPINGNLRKGLTTLHTAISLYIKFRENETIAPSAPKPLTPVASAPRPTGSSGHETIKATQCT